MYKKLYIKTWGCQMNEYDSNKIIYLLKKKYEVTDKINESDVIILNTCSVRHKAHEKLFHQLGRIKKIKKNKPDSIVLVGGCVSVKEKKNIFNRSDIVDIIFGPKTIYKINYLISEFKKKRKKIIDLNSNKLFENLNNNLNYIENVKLSSFVPIMEGCNKFCSYCVVPFTRGREISRKPENIIEEIKKLSDKGVKEINLLGQNVSSYISFFSNGKICDFTSLLYCISEINKIKRIRFMTSHPCDFSDRLINCYKDISKIVNFLHLPVQSGSNRILKKMKRNYTIEFYKKIIEKLLLVRPKMVFSSDFIVGFPGETENDFILTLDLVKEIKFDNSFCFLYSPRPGTKSFFIKDKISYLEKKKRLYILNSLIKKNYFLSNEKMLFSKQNVLVEGLSKKNNKFLYGRTDNNRIVHFLGNNNIIGNLIKIKITESNKNCLYGIII